MRTIVRQMMRVSRKQSLIAFFLTTCLILLLHILVVFARNAKQTATNVQDHVGIFLYLRDSAIGEGVKMLEEFTEGGLHATYFSKEDAFRLMAKKLPNILGQLEKYGIQNPLPPTIYVTYRDQLQYETIRSIVARHDVAISNLDNLSLNTSFQEQTRRVSKLVTMMHIVISVCIFLVIGVIVMIAMIVSYIITTLFYRFQSQLELATLIGGSWSVILAPFLLMISLILSLAWISSNILGVISSQRINTYFLDALEVSFIQHYLPEGSLRGWLGIELLCLLILALILAHFHLRSFMKNHL